MTGPASTPRLLVKATCGSDDAERANQALTVAAAGVALGAPVSLWLTGEGVWFAVAGRQPDLGLAGATPAADLVATVLDAAPDGAVTVCSQCAARRDLTEADLVPGAVIRGAAVFAEQVLGDDVRALVY